MSQRTPACNERLADMRADTTLRTLAELDSLEPSRALDRAVLGLAREAASGRAPHVGAGGRSLRWGLPAAVVAAAVCAAVVQRTASRPEAPRVADQRFIVERFQPSQSNALEMVRVSAHYRGARPQVASTAVTAYLAPSGLDESHLVLIPSFIFASAPLLSIRTAPLRKHGTEEQTPRAATRSSERASRRDREWTARRRVRQPWLIDSVGLSQPVFDPWLIDSVDSRPAPPPRPGLESVVGSSGHSAQVRDARAQAAPAGTH